MGNEAIGVERGGKGGIDREREREIGLTMMRGFYYSQSRSSSLCDEDMCQVCPVQQEIIPP